MGVTAVSETGMSSASLVLSARDTSIMHGPPAACVADSRRTLLTASAVGARRGLLAKEKVSTTSPPTPGLPSAPGGAQRSSQMSLPCMPLVLLARKPIANHPPGELYARVRFMLVSRALGASQEMSTRPTDRERRGGAGAAGSREAGVGRQGDAALGEGGVVEESSALRRDEHATRGREQEEARHVLS